jgi:phosphoribosylanthranilate isomerase
MNAGKDAGGARLRVKICGVRRPWDAREAVRAGADAVGVILAESPRRASPDEAGAVARAAREEAEALGRAVDVFGVFVDEEPARILEIARLVPLDVAQLHGDEGPGVAGPLAGLRLVKAVRVRGPESTEEIELYAGAPGFEAVLLDSFDETARGGTGRAFDWEVAAAASRRARVILAGGLAPSNVAEAVRRVRPFMVDASSGVERAPGVKDAALVREFVAKARAASLGGGPGGEAGRGGRT